MAADDERAQRFRETYEQRKAQDPRAYTWKRLADHVGISERAVQDWAKTGGVDYDNARKAAEFWTVDFDWLWRGDPEETQTPDPFASQDDLAGSLEQIHIKLDLLLTAAGIKLPEAPTAKPGPIPRYRPPDEDQRQAG